MDNDVTGNRGGNMDRPLTRQDVKRSIMQAERQRIKLNLSGKNLSNADLSELNLSGADLRGADLRGADLNKTNLFLANLSGADLRGARFSRTTDLHEADLRGARYFKALGLSDLRGTIFDFGEALFEKPGILRLRITEQPLTATNLTNTMLATTELYSKLWLTKRGRISDLVEYSLTHSQRFEQEANLVIERIRHNSPLNMELKVDVSPEGAGKGLGEAIDAIAQVGLRREQAKVAVKQAEIEVKKSDAEIETKRAEIERETRKAESVIMTEAVERRIKSELAEEELADREQARQANAKRQGLELEAQAIANKERLLELRKKEYEFEIGRLHDAMEIAKNLIEMLLPDIDTQTKAIAAQTYIKNILELDEVRGLELVTLPAPATFKSKRDG